MTWPWISTSIVLNTWEISMAAGACPVLRREQLITPKSLLSTACGRSWTELYYNKGRYKQCQISSAAITMIGPESRGWSPHGVMAHDVDTERRKGTRNSCVLLWDPANNYLYHLAYSLFDNSLPSSEVTDCGVELLCSKLQQREYQMASSYSRKGVFLLHAGKTLHEIYYERVLMWVCTKWMHESTIVVSKI